MAQPRVTDYFASKKKTNGRLPAKRRKVDITHDEGSVTVVKEHAQKTSQPISLGRNVESVEESVSISSTKSRRKPRKQSSKTQVCTPGVRITRRKGAVNVSDNQQTIHNALANLASNRTIQSDETDANKGKIQNSKNVEDINNHDYDTESESLSLHWDEIDGGDGCQNKEITPIKQIKTDKKNGRNSRHHVINSESITPSVENGHGAESVLTASSRSARKCLQLHAEEDESVTVRA